MGVSLGVDELGACIEFVDEVCDFKPSKLSLLFADAMVSSILSLSLSLSLSLRSPGSRVAILFSLPTPHAQSDLQTFAYHPAACLICFVMLTGPRPASQAHCGLSHRVPS